MIFRISSRKYLKVTTITEKRIILCIVLIGLMLRIYNIDSLWLPPFIDEVRNILYGREIFLTYGLVNWVTWSRKAMYVIFALPFFLHKELLLNPEHQIIITRTISVISSTISIWLFWIISKRFFDNNSNYSILATLIFTIMPFNVFYGRLALYYPIAQVLYLLSIYLSLRVLEIPSLARLVILLIFSSYVYFTLPWSYIINLPTILLIGYLCKGPYSIKKIFAMCFILLLPLILFTVFPHLLHNYSILFKKWFKPESGWPIGPFGWDTSEQVVFSLTHIFNYLNPLSGYYFYFLLVLFLISIVTTFKKTKLKFSRFVQIKFKIQNVRKIRIKREKGFIILALMLSLISIYHGIYPRRIIFITPLLSLFLPFQLKTVKETIMYKRVTLVIVAAFLLLSIAIDLSYITNITNAPLPSVIRLIYVDRYTSGYGCKEISQYIKENISSNSLYLTDIPEHLKFYLGEEYKILNVEENFQLIESNKYKGEVFLILKKEYMVKWAYKKGFTEVTRIEIPFSDVDDQIVLFKVNK